MGGKKKPKVQVLELSEKEHRAVDIMSIFYLVIKLPY